MALAPQGELSALFAGEVDPCPSAGPPPAGCCRRARDP